MNPESNKLMEDLLVVLVLFKCTLHESPAFTSLTEDLKGNRCTLFVYDNSPQAQVFANKDWDIIYVHDPSNPGVSKAYNEGFKKAKELKKKWLLLVDQDTEFPIHFFNNLNRATEKNSSFQIFVPIVKNGSAMIISPFKFNKGRGISMKEIPSKLQSLQNLKFINSGLVVSNNLFEQCNGYDEDFPLDYSDLVFIQRLKQFQDHFVVIDVECYHKLSSDERDISKSLIRFKYYLNASKQFGKKYGPTFYLFLNRILRTIKLSTRFKSIKFLKLLFQSQG